LRGRQGQLHLRIRTLLAISVLMACSATYAGETEEAEGAIENLPIAEDVDLQKPVADPLPPAKQDEPGLNAPAEPESVAGGLPPATSRTGTRVDTPEQPERVTRKQTQPFVILGHEVQPGTSTRLGWAPSQSFEGVYAPTPVLVVHGDEPGPVLCLTSAVHGDELNGIETVRRVMHDLNPEALSGTVVGVPIVNLQGFHRGSRYLSDRRDLNRFFPGTPDGSLASRIAHSFFNEVIVHCSALVDLHTGSYYRTNLPQLRADLSNDSVVDLTRGFGSTVVLHSAGADGTLRRAAVEYGIPTVTLEAGGAMVMNEKAVIHSVKSIATLLDHMQMLRKRSLWGDPEPVYFTSVWQRAPVGGVIFSKVKLGEDIEVGEMLGTITNPITNVRTELHSAHHGKVLGMAVNQFVQPGFAAYHIGITAPPEEFDSPVDPADSVDVEVDDTSPPDMDHDPDGDAQVSVDAGELNGD